MEFEYSLLAKYLTGNISLEELSVIQAWAESSAQNAAIWKKVVALRIKDNFDRINTPEQIEQALLAIQTKIGRKRFHLSFRSFLRYAAVLFIVLGAIGYYVYNQESSYISIIVDAQEDVKRITLRDGSKVWLRGGTIMCIPNDFGTNNRSVSIEGEAFFQVEKDSLSPFVVKANDLFVKVLGTSFNLKTIADENKIETILISGHVVLQNEDKKDLLDISPGEKVIFDTKRQTLNIEQVDVNVQSIWRHEQSILEKMSLGEITERIADIYQVHFNFSTKQLIDKKYRFVFNKEESIEEICSDLEQIAPIRCTIEGREIFVSYQE